MSTDLHLFKLRSSVPELYNNLHRQDLLAKSVRHHKSRHGRAMLLVDLIKL
jgi:hypothetical protein